LEGSFPWLWKGALKASKTDRPPRPHVDYPLGSLEHAPLAGELARSEEPLGMRWRSCQKDPGRRSKIIVVMQ
jgi:hypothetical protein